MIYLFLAHGFEETEAIVPLNLLRRAELLVAVVGIGGRTITGAHGITIVCDQVEGEANLLEMELLVLPGGIPGTLMLEHSPLVQAYIDFAHTQGIPIGAIGAAPSILGHRGLLAGRRAACAPGFEEQLPQAILTGNPVEQDGPFITANGPAAAMDFGLTLVERLLGKERAEQLGASVQWPR